MCRVCCWCLPASLRKTHTSMNRANCVHVQLITAAAARTAAPLTIPQHTVCYKGQRERRMPCPPEKFPLTPHKHYCFLSEMCRTKHSLCFKVVKLASKEKMQSISRKRKHSPGILLHMNWIKKRSLWCITFAACGESFHLKDTEKQSLLVSYIFFQYPKAARHSSHACTWSPTHRDSLWAFKNCISRREL